MLLNDLAYRINELIVEELSDSAPWSSNILVDKSLVLFLLLWGGRCVQDLCQVFSWLCPQYIYHHLLSPRKRTKLTKLAPNGTTPARDLHVRTIVQNAWAYIAVYNQMCIYTLRTPTYTFYAFIPDKQSFQTGIVSHFAFKLVNKAESNLLFSSLINNILLVLIWSWITSASCVRDICCK